MVVKDKILHVRLIWDICIQVYLLEQNGRYDNTKPLF